jgi:hypothetical protein
MLKTFPYLIFKNIIIQQLYFVENWHSHWPSIFLRSHQFDVGLGSNCFTSENTGGILTCLYFLFVFLPFFPIMYHSVSVCCDQLQVYRKGDISLWAFLKYSIFSLFPQKINLTIVHMKYTAALWLCMLNFPKSPVTKQLQNLWVNAENYQEGPRCSIKIRDQILQAIEASER